MKKRVKSASKPSTRNGFTMMEALLALLVVSVCLQVGTAYLRVAQKLVAEPVDTQREFMILQLRHFVAQATTLEVESERIELVVRHERFTIEQDGSRLVKRGGYEILDEQVETVRFWEEGEAVFVEIDGRRFQIA
ncbi:hypothetical protein [uncultured Dubosiella sp.]|uniref:hypothetical protein n=1 Tax=uncultured Dubosiella sp. TaxID=1937011 RepID=UPI0025968D39|nr:hypothetical protein [uncultured Dubosiella sp.]